MGKRTDRWDEAHAREVVESWERSGESAERFAQRFGVRMQRLVWWKWKLGRGVAASEGRKGSSQTVGVKLFTDL